MADDPASNVDDDKKRRGRNMATQFDRADSLRASLQNDRESAWEAARYDRDQRDQVTSRIRFGSVVFNGASLLTVINNPAFLAEAPEAIVLTSSGLFLLGVVCAGVSLVAHQTGLIEKAGYSAARAMAMDRAVSLAAKPSSSPEYATLGKVMDEAHDLHKKMIAPRISAIFLQNASTGAWLGGALTIASFKARESLPPWPWF